MTSGLLFRMATGFSKFVLGTEGEEEPRLHARSQSHTWSDASGPGWVGAHSRLAM